MAKTPSLHAGSFPPGFTFGTSGSAYQYEGAAFTDGKGPSIWDNFTNGCPGKISDRSNGNVANDSYHRYKEDVAIMKRMGVNAYRFSISWPRILPSGRLRDGVNKEGVNYYNNLIDELIANGIEPWVTLFHWDLPQALETEYEGFLDRKVVDDFCNYAEVCFWEFGDRVKHWITLNEPWTYSIFGYVTGEHPPGRGIQTSSTALSPATPIKAPTLASTIRPSSTTSALHRMAALDRYSCSRRVEVQAPPLQRTTLAAGMVSPSVAYTALGNPETEPYRVAHHQLLAHAKAVDLYRKNFQKIQKGTIGISLNTTWYEPLQDGNKEDLAAAQRAMDFKFGWFMEPLRSGTYPSSMKSFVKEGLLPEFDDAEIKMLKGSFDFIGINYYTSNYATKPLSSTEYKELPFHVQTHRGEDPIGPKGSSAWVYSYPKGLYKMLNYMKEKYDNPLIYITENGVDEIRDNNSTLPKTRNDIIRQDYLDQHLTSLRDVIDIAKVNLKGYFVWSLLDNFELSRGYTSCFGLNYVDYQNGLTRHPRNSAIWYTNFLKGKGDSFIIKDRNGEQERKEHEDDTRATKKRKGSRVGF